jgi:hypothetical protein
VLPGLGCSASLGTAQPRALSASAVQSKRRADGPREALVKLFILTRWPSPLWDVARPSLFFLFHSGISPFLLLSWASLNVNKEKRASPWLKVAEQKGLNDSGNKTLRFTLSRLE